MRILVKSFIIVFFFTASNFIFAAPDTSRLWVQFAPQKSEQALSALSTAGAKIHYRFDNLNAAAVTLPTKAIQALRNNPNIQLIEEDVKRYPSAQSVPYGIDAVQARDIWDANRDGYVDYGVPDGSGKMVCVIDSGLHTAHEDMMDVNVVGGFPSGSSGWNNDTCGHGTHVTGTITATNNGIGVVGVNPGSTSLFIVQVFGGSTCAWTYSSTLVDAANRCQVARADIISMSLGGTSKSRTEERAFSKLYDDGILLIAAAGNDGNNRKSYPASYNSVMSVAAVDVNNMVADFSQQNSSVEIAAPGVAVLSTVPWTANNSLTVDGTTYSGGQIKYAALATITGDVINGGLCDSAGSWFERVVMCERGDISFFEKVSNVRIGGGIAAVIYNNEPGGFVGTLGEGNSSTIPAISLSQADGQAIVAAKLGFSSIVASTFTQPGSGYEAWDGTSMATPHVSGVAALVWSGSPGSTNADIRYALTQTALDLGEPGRDAAYGYGLVQAYDAWLYLGGGGGSSNQSPTAAFTSNCPDLRCTFDGSDSSDPDGTIDDYAWTFGDGNSASGVISSHTFGATDTFIVSLKVTDNKGASNTRNESVSVSAGSGGSGGDTTPPVISNVNSAKTKGNSFEITWTTDEPASSKVIFSCCGEFSNAALVTSHRMEFRGGKGVYTFYVSSKDAANNESTVGPFDYP
ncbi:S8 family serine peptidase [Colwellia sp. TT2012]|uniref:S8 family serine peptidase n=1 Tax=Colwellia sp. TT2012 TaxID=1720342 RepID=UPI0018D2618F|nr:S8 family serine peptidase [Colwellia sp. TT2012]